MSKLPETMNENLPTTNDAVGAWMAFGADADTPILKFNRGKYVAGADQDEVPLGTRLIVAMPEMRAGFKKWEDGKPVDERMALIHLREPIPQRQACGDTDESLWPRDDRGDPQDPWASTFEVPMADIETGEEYLFASGSRGGINALGKLGRTFGKRLAQYPEELPIVALDAGSYRHKQYGDVEFPVFRIVGWQRNDPGAEPAPAEARPAPPIVDHQAPLGDPSDPGPSEDAYGEPFPL